MDVKEFFEKHSIDEISKKTKISPISLEYIKNREFDKLTKVKFLGFLKIIEKEFKVNLDELREEYNNFHSREKEEVKEILKEESNSSKGSLLIVILALLFLGGGFYFYLKKNHKEKSSNSVLYVEKNSSEKNSSSKVQIVVEQPPKIEKVKESEKKVEVEVNETNRSEVKEVNVSKPQKVVKRGVLIVPHKKLWFKAINLDTHKSAEFLTSTEKNLTGKNYYLKLGHGLVTIYYNDLNISPNSKNIVRILLKDGNYTYLPKHNRFEK